MDSSIVQLVNQYAISDISHITHTSLFSPKGKYNFGREGYTKFLTDYCELLHLNKGDIPNGITEIPQSEIPIIVDIDLSVPEEEMGERTHLYDEDSVLNIIEKYHEILKLVIESELKPEHLICCLLEKEPYVKEYSNKKRVVKNGFHLHFPNLIVRKCDYENIIYPKVLKRISEMRLFDDLKVDDEVNYSQIMDNACFKNPWLIYGARKSPEMQPYKLTKIYDYELKQVHCNILKCCDVKTSNGTRIVFKNNIEYYYPFIFSIHTTYNEREVLRVKEDRVFTSSSNVKSKKVNLVDIERTDEQIQEDIDVATQLLPMIGIWRAEEYGEWMQMGWALYNISDGRNEGLDLWIEFSRQSDKFEDGSCEQRWEKMEKKYISIGSLCFYASQDSPTEYDNWKDERLMKLSFELGMYQSHNDVARILKEMYGNKFVCASLKYKTWYEYRDNRWKQVEEGSSLRSKITTDVCNVVKKYHKRLIKKILEKQDNVDVDDNSELNKENKDKMKMAEKMVTKIIGNLKTAPFKNNVMREAMELFYDDKFLKRLNTNNYLIGFKNGVYDLEKNILRKGCPDDYISLRMDINYVKMASDDKRLKDIDDFFIRVFPDNSVRRYFLDVYSDIFVGGNTLKQLRIWSGEGDNSKSITEGLFEKMLGEYAVKLPTSLIVGKRSASGSACPELHRAGNGVRWAVVQEPDKRDILNLGIIKELTGNDTFFARTLFEAGGEMTPMFVLDMVCNDPPLVPYSDKATWNRLRIIPFESTFCVQEECPDTFEEQLREKKFPKDPHFADKIPDMIEALAFRLLEHRRTITNMKHIIEPPKVRHATEKYRNKNDLYRQFETETIVEDSDSIITLRQVYSAFKEWYRESVGIQNMPTKQEAKDCFIKLWGESTERGMGWLGKKISIQDDDLCSKSVI